MARRLLYFPGRSGLSPPRIRPTASGRFAHPKRVGRY